MPMLFLFKKDDEFAKTVRKFMKKEYETPALYQYYDEVLKNMEAE